MAKQPTIYVITWRYFGEPGSGVVGAYLSMEAAERVLKVLEAHGDMSKSFEITVAKDVEVG